MLTYIVTLIQTIAGNWVARVTLEREPQLALFTRVHFSPDEALDEANEMLKKHANNVL